MIRNHWRRRAAAAVVFALCRPAHLLAQTEAGVARDAKTGAPLECLHVALIDSTNRAIAHAVTDANGQFQLEAPHPGSFRVRFELFGWEPLGGPLDTLGDGGFKQRRYPLDFQNLMMPKGLPLRSMRKSCRVRYGSLRTSSSTGSASEERIAIHFDGDAMRRGLERNWAGGFERISGLIDIFGERGSWQVTQ